MRTENGGVEMEGRDVVCDPDVVGVILECHVCELDKWTTSVLAQLIRSTGSGDFFRRSAHSLDCLVVFTRSAKLSKPRSY